MSRVSRSSADRGSVAAGWAAVLVGVPGAIVAVIFLLSYLNDSDDSTSTPEPPAEDIRVSPPEDPVDPSPSETPGDQDDGGSCQITIANPFATIYEQRDVFSQEITLVPAGTYSAQDIQNETTPLGTNRWFLISVDGRSGWIEDSTMMVHTKSPSCP